MSEPFSSLEIQLMKFSLATKTDEQIAELLERSVEEVQVYIDEITGGASADRSRDVAQYLQEKAEKKKRIVKTPAPLEQTGSVLPKPFSEKQLADMQKKERIDRERDIRNKNELLKVASQKREQKRLYKTKKVDWDQMESYRIDRKTIIFVPKDMSQREKEKYILQYKMREEERIIKIKSEEI